MPHIFMKISNLKHAAITGAALLTLSSAYAEGYQVNTLSTRQLGMGHTGVAQKLGAESQIFNPAGVSFSKKTFELSGSVSAISATADAWTNGEKFTTDNKLSTPMNVSAAFRIYDNLYAGVTFYTPYGSSINWGRNWPGAPLNQSVDLKVFTLQPTVSWRITPKLAVGAGLMVSWGSVNLNKGLVTPEAFEQTVDLYNRAQVLTSMVTGQPAATLPVKDYGYNAPASISLEGSTRFAFGLNVGVMYEINDKWTVGADFRSKMNMKVGKGDAAIQYDDQVAQMVLNEQLNVLDEANFSASMPAPYVLTIGASYKPIPRLTLAFDAQLNGWKAYKTLDIEFAGIDEKYNQHITKDYHNAMTYHVGGEYAVTNRFDARLGLMIDTSPCNKEHYNPETPGTTKLEPSLGFSFRPFDGFSIDFALMYVHGMKVKDASVKYNNLLAPAYNSSLAQYDAVMGALGQTSGLQSMPLENEFRADYKVSAWIPSIGLSYSF